MFLCLCECGKNVVVRLEYLSSGHTMSCGCQRIISTINTKTTHGCCGKDSRTDLYGVWSNMKARCSNGNQISYKNYGARGIKVCREWMDFIPFLEWAMSNGYKEGLTIERNDCSGNYEPSNCRWATVFEQNNNKRNNVLIDYDDKKLTASQWSKIVGINPETISSRLRYGWSVEKALETPVKMTAYVT